jgi:Integrase zinc binding domain
VLIIEITDRPEPPPTKTRGAPWIEMRKPLPPLTAEMVRKAQVVDIWCQELINRVEAGEPGLEFTAEGFLFRKTEGRRPQVIVPPKLRDVVLHLAHLPPQAAHPGTRRMWENISREFYWPTLKRDCAEYVSQCLSCAAVKAPISRRTRPLQLFPPD